MSFLKEKYDECFYCQNYYGPNFNEPFCITCHYFIFPSNIEIVESVNDTSSINSNPQSSISNSNTQLINNANNTNLNENSTLSSTTNTNEAGPSDVIWMQTCSSNLIHVDPNRMRNYLEKLESNDSGNEDSDEQHLANNLVLPQNINTANNSSIVINHNASNNLTSNRMNPVNAICDISSHNGAGNLNNNNNCYAINYTTRSMGSYKPGQYNTNKKPSPLSEQISSLTVYRDNNKCVDYDLFESLPNEVLLCIFRNLDDLSLWSVSAVCKKWHELIKQEISQAEWKSFITKRWVLFKSAIQVKCYQTLFSQLVESSNCFYCLHQIHNREDSFCDNELKKSWRHKRLLLELKALQQDPPDGISAKPLDKSCFYWQASITGPSGSPYEGGIYFLFLQIPPSYPLNPPLVRFITKIYHPNISRHGEIGLDSIHDNWSLALTISKVLISIQSLLTDPYTHVCMEKEIGHLYDTDRDLYETNAKSCTLKYAMSDYLIFDNQSLVLLNQFSNLSSEENDI
jgi:ubiquitin-conjugating enzyme E2 D/E